MWAPAAMASTSPSGDAGVVNLSHNQVPVQACNDNVPVNVLGVQVPVSHVSGAGNLLSPGATTAAGQDSSCHQASGQLNNTVAETGVAGTTNQMAGANGAANQGTSDPASQGTSDSASQGTSDSAGDFYAPADPSSGGDAGVVNLSHNQVPLQACNDQVPVNVLGVQVPVDDVVAALGILAPVSGTFAGQDTSCHQGSVQANG